MTRQQIEQAAKENASTHFGLINKEWWARKNGFEDGAQWRIDSVWHDKDERPKFNKVEKEGILLLYSFGQCVFLYLDKDEWEHLLSYATFVKWAYIDDLLPQGKEEE